ncbi:MAG: tail fiber domain-containing protein [Saprospiraceae bacterium]|nr:tail fiber domain-containing protein [Saprospiraceae bacterium]
MNIKYIYFCSILIGLLSGSSFAQNLQVEGTLTAGSLSGNGTKMVITDNNGLLGTQDIPIGGGGSSLWLENGSDIYYADGRVGIGLSSPTALLHILRPIGVSLNEPLLKLENNSNQTFGAKTGLSVTTTVDGDVGRNGIQNITSQSATADGNFNGILNNGFPGGSGTSYGIRNLLANSNTPIGQMYGISSQVTSHSSNAELVYGLYNDVTKEGSGRHTGIYNVLREGTSSDTAFVSVHENNGGYAGKFVGNVEVTDQLGIGMSPETNLELQVNGDVRAINMGVSKTGADSYTDGIFVSGAYQDGMSIFTQFTGSSFQNTYGMKSEATGLNSSQTIYGIYGRANFAFGSSTAYGVYADKQSGGSGYALYVNGDAFKTGTGVWTTSDEQLKENIKPLAKAMTLINALEPSEYHFKQDEKYTLLNLPTEKQYGFVAQDVEAVVPELVKETDLQFREAVRDGTTDGVFSETYKALNYQMLIPILTQGIKEQQIEIADLRQKNEQLEESIAILRQEVEQIRSQIEIESSAEPEADVWLDQNTPNPFATETFISFQLPDKVKSASLMITAPNGQMIKEYEIASGGKGQVKIPSSLLPSGLYYYSLIIEGTLMDTKSMIVTH